MGVGFYGKLPSHGDFLRRRVSDAFVDAWDAWLRDCLAAARDDLGPGWLDVYLTSPAWRFVCAAGVCGPTAVVGLLAPSVDRVGRYFPLTIVAEMPAGTSLAPAAAAAAGFLDAAELLVIETLATEHVDFETFDSGILALEEELTQVISPPTLVLDRDAAGIFGDDVQAWHLPLSGSSHIASAFQELLSCQLEERYKPLVLWWTDGSAVVEPSCLLVKGLPAPDQYASLLKGNWAGYRWRSVAAHAPHHAAPRDPVTLSLDPLSFRSAAATDVGRARGNNEDGFIERPEVGLWAVADGMGGHVHGEVASRMVCDALADFHPDGTFEEAIASASVRLRAVNDYLLRMAKSPDLSDVSGSTVVLLMLRGARSAILWAGDSRVYRWRAGELQQLSRDHSLAELEGPEAAASSVITRAVGVQPDLALDVEYDVVLPQDRFLLCSDGLTRVIPDSQIAELMQTESIEAAVDGLIEATLDAGAPDNVTVIIAEAYR
jgi:type VI secretion system protein ImpM